MINRIKEYLMYVKYKRTAKREIARMAATVLPIASEMAGKGADIAKFVVKLTNETKNVEGEKLVEMVLNEVSAVLQTDNNRIIEILTYIVNLEPSDIQKIITHAVVDTLPTDEKAE